MLLGRKTRSSFRARLPRRNPLILELLEDRLPPGDLGWTGLLFLGNLDNESQPEERRVSARPDVSLVQDDDSAAGRLDDLTTTLGAINPFSNPAVTAASVLPAGTASDQGPSLITDLTEAFNVEGPGITSGPEFFVSENARVNNREICPGGTTGKIQSEVSLVFEPISGAMVVGYNDFRGFYCPTMSPGYQVTGWGYALDGGFSFTDGGPLPGGSGVANRGDPWLAAGPDGTIYLAGLHNPLSAMSLQRGTVTEKGISWAPNTTLITTDGGYDKEAMAVNPDTGTIVITYTRFGGPNGIWSHRSTDGGATFERAVPVRTGSSPQLQGSYPAFGTGGELFVAYNIGYPGTTGAGFAVSYDEGSSYVDFGQVATISDFQIPGHSRGRLNFPQLAVDTSGGPNNGSLYLVYATTNTGTNGDVVLIRSSDGGASWSAPLTVNDDSTTGIQFFPTIAVDSNGYVNIAFYDRRDNPGATSTLTHLYYAQSRDGGLSFLPNIPVTDTVSNWNFTGEGSPNYGDYIHSIAYGPYYAVAWADSRDGDPDAYLSWVVALDL